MSEVVKAKLKKAMSDNMITNAEQAQEAIDFVMDLLDVNIVNTIENEPYATRSIASMEEARSRVSDLEELIRDL